MPSIYCIFVHMHVFFLINFELRYKWLTMLWYFQENSRWTAKGLSDTYTCIHLLKFPSHPHCHISIYFTLQAYTLIEDITTCCCSLSHVQLFATPWTAANQTSPSITNSQSLLKLMSIASAMTFSLLILSRPLLLPPSIFRSIRVFSSESVLFMRWPKYWSFSFSISPSNEYSGLISLKIDCC